MILPDETLTRQFRLSNARRPLLFAVQFVLCFFLLAFQDCVLAQDEPDSEVVRIRTDLVTVPTFILDNQGRRVTGLTATDFELRDDGRVVKIDYFVNGTERVALVFALDASGSTRDVIVQQRETALALFSRFGHGSEVAVMRFADTAEIISPFSSDREDAVRAFDLPVLVNHRTAIFDSVASAIHAFDARQPDVTERRIIILISDGLDTISAMRPDKIIYEAKNRGISVYAIQIPLYTPRDGRLRPRAASKGFREIAEKSGGRFFIAGNAKSALTSQTTLDLSPIFQAIEDDLRGQYVLGYYPEEAIQDGRYHRIDLNLTLKDKRKLRVYSLREGYNSKQ